MNKIRIVFALFLIAGLGACGITNYTVEEAHKTYPYNEYVTFSVKSVKRTSGMGTGYGSYNPKKGYKFYQFNIVFQNVSKAEQAVHFDSIFLAEPKTRTYYKADFILVPSVFTVMAKEEKNLKPGDSKERVVMFTAPADLSPTSLLVNGELHQLVIRKN